MQFSYVKILARMMKPVYFLFNSILVYPIALSAFSQVNDGKIPYPASPVIKNITFDFSTHIRLAPGSDNWPITWADDNNQYSAWGDGGGFHGTNSLGRVTLGVARIEGEITDYKGYNVWGGYESENKPQFEGKSFGILCVDRILYMWVAPQPNPHLLESRLLFSIDCGKTWKRADWAFTFGEDMTVPTFLNFGKNYNGARDGFVYSYFIHPQWGPENSSEGQFGFNVHAPGKIYLTRTPKDRILQRDQFEFFTGLDRDGRPAWSRNLPQKKPVFEDSNGVGWNVSVSYNQPLNRYVLCTEHTKTHAGKLGIFDSPEPWGPWSTVAYYDSWGENNISANTFFWNFSTKWLSGDGIDFVLLFSGKDTNDSWNTVQGSFSLIDSEKTK